MLSDVKNMIKFEYSTLCKIMHFKPASLLSPDIDEIILDIQY